MLNVTSKVGVIRQAIIHDLSKVRHLFKSTVGPAVEFIASGNQTLRIPQKTVPAPWCHERRERDGSFRQRDLPIPMTGIQLREKLGIADIRHDVTRCARRVCWSSDLVVQFFEVHRQSFLVGALLCNDDDRVTPVRRLHGDLGVDL